MKIRFLLRSDGWVSYLYAVTVRNRIYFWPNADFSLTFPKFPDSFLNMQIITDYTNIYFDEELQKWVPCFVEIIQLNNYSSFSDFGDLNYE